MTTVPPLRPFDRPGASRGSRWWRWPRWSCWWRAAVSRAAALPVGLQLGLLALGFWGLHLAVMAVMAGMALQGGDAGIGLHVDEAQYWQWSRELQWGYYSKPPVIAALIAASTALVGDGLLGVKGLVMLCHPLAAAVTGSLAHAMCLAALQDGRAIDGAAPPTLAEAALARRVTLAAALLVATSPLASLLGLVATTDAPLMLCWALAAHAGWHLARRAWRRDALLLGLALAAGLLSKYTLAALLPTVLAWLLWPPIRAGAGAGAVAAPPLRWRGLATALGLAWLLCLPHLAWNAEQGWPTLRHTADITLLNGRGPAAGTMGLGLRVGLSVAEFLAGQALQFGPLWVILLVWPGRAGQRRASPAAQTEAAAAAWRGHTRRALWLAWPLLGIGLAQAALSRAQVNWTAPAGIGLALALALHWGGQAQPPGAQARRGLPPPGRAGAVMALHLLLGAAIALAPLLPHWPRALDIWSRMRGWEGALQRLEPAVAAHLKAHPQAQVIVLDRTTLVQAAYAWRALPAIHWLAWRSDRGAPARHHYELTTRWAAAGSPAALAPLLVLAPGREAGDLPAALRERLGPLQRLGEGTRWRAPGEGQAYTLWQATRRDAQSPVGSDHGSDRGSDRRSERRSERGAAGPAATPVASEHTSP